MSRCTVDSLDPALEVVVGWDPPTGTFFAQVLHIEDEEELFALGIDDGRRYVDPASCVEFIRPVAAPFDHQLLIRRLREDQAANSSREYALADTGPVATAVRLLRDAARDAQADTRWPGLAWLQRVCARWRWPRR